MHIFPSFTSKHILRHITSLSFILLVYATPTYSQSPTHPWYIGREVCMPIFFGNLKTQLQDQHPSSLQYGLSGGYKLYRFLDIELSLDYGNSRLTARSADYGYYLDRHGKTYSTAQIPGTVSYSQIYSQLKYAGIGIHAPLHLNHFLFQQSKHYRLTLLLSPCLAINRYKSKIRLKYSDQTWLPSQIHWSFELSTDLLLRYNLSKRIDFQLRTGIKYITNKKFDGLSAHHPHNTSYVWTSGLSLLYKFGKNKLLNNN